MIQVPQPDLAGIVCAAETIAPYLQETPLLRSELLSRVLDADIWLKHETMTPIASFKIRGALNAIVVAQRSGVTSVVTASTGNHGQGVAYSARLLGMEAHIFLPKPANRVKADMIEAFGGTLHEIGDDYDESRLSAIEYAEKHNLTMITDGKDLDVMYGAGTVGLEISNQLGDIDLVLIPMGGGNLSAGSVTAIKAVQPGTRVISVQAEGAPAVYESFHARRIIEKPVNTLADGLITRVPLELTLSVLWRLLDDVWLVDDDNLLAATHSLITLGHVMAEPSSAAALAGAYLHKSEVKGKRVVLVITSANISAEMLQRVMSTPPII